MGLNGNIDIGYERGYLWLGDYIRSRDLSPNLKTMGDGVAQRDDQDSWDERTQNADAYQAFGWLHELGADKPLSEDSI